MSWFYNSWSGELTHASGVDALAYQAAIHTGAGWHELKVPDSATEAQAAADAVKEVPGGTTPTTSLGQGLANLPGAAAQAAGASVPGLSQVGSFFGSLTQAATWIRVLKIVVGGLLLLEGIMRASGASKTVLSAGKAAAKGALLLWHELMTALSPSRLRRLPGSSRTRPPAP